MSTTANGNEPKPIESKRNIEIKARIHGENEFVKRVEIAKKLTNTSGELIPQHDVFFKVANGRLKLRYLQVSRWSSSAAKSTLWMRHFSGQEISIGSILSTRCHRAEAVGIQCARNRWAAIAPQDAGSLCRSSRRGEERTPSIPAWTDSRPLGPSGGFGTFLGVRGVP